VVDEIVEEAVEEVMEEMVKEAVESGSANRKCVCLIRTTSEVVLVKKVPGENLA